MLKTWDYTLKTLKNWADSHPSFYKAIVGCFNHKPFMELVAQKIGETSILPHAPTWSMGIYTGTLIELTKIIPCSATFNYLKHYLESHKNNVLVHNAAVNAVKKIAFDEKAKSIGTLLLLMNCGYGYWVGNNS